MLEIEIDIIIKIDKKVWEGSPPNHREESHKFLVDDLPLTPKQASLLTW